MDTQAGRTGSGQATKRRKWESVSPWASGVRPIAAPLSPSRRLLLLACSCFGRLDTRTSDPLSSPITPTYPSAHPTILTSPNNCALGNDRTKNQNLVGIRRRPCRPPFPRHARHFRPGVAPSLVPSASAAVSSQARVSTASSTATVPGRLTSKLPCPASKDSNTTSSNEVPDVTVQP